jgi:hypothetical protein
VFLPSADTNQTVAVCRRPRTHFFDPPPPDFIEISYLKVFYDDQ